MKKQTMQMAVIVAAMGLALESRAAVDIDISFIPQASPALG
jgi:hypothetical protein